MAGKEESLLSRRHKSVRGSRPSLCVTPSTSDSLEDKSCATIEDASAVADRIPECHSDLSSNANPVPRTPAGRGLLAPPPVSPRMRKMARQKLDVGADLSQEAGSLGWFLRRRSFLQRETDGLTCSFLYRFGGLNVESDTSPWTESDVSGKRDSWRGSEAFSGSAGSTSVQSSFNGSFGASSTLGSSECGSSRCSPQNISQWESKQPNALPPDASNRSNRWQECGWKGSLVGKRQRSPDGMAVEKGFGCSISPSFAAAALSSSLQHVAASSHQVEVGGGVG
eukprot:CAMPEP_0181324114 /NCGR_PEP_ID=MMETSP1101-20121128/20173_1 /TAXON_ID=46948 /ORGANISM="Rhodomonas abbreviata, Strain Caron Lab Isolate" /LENGTH=280 /DNA_ID=CAMNT_0023432241 /DNA_START=277 /DNA_END=1115 /DNA_ORIENTATION=-